MPLVGSAAAVADRNRDLQTHSSAQRVVWVSSLRRASRMGWRRLGLTLGELSPPGLKRITRRRI
jgi:hypothetical protein